jgi:ATP-dependent Clp protease protease subunit
VFGEIDMRLAERVTAQITALSAESDKPIRMIINSPGGHVESGDTIHDMIRFCGVEVKAIGTGWVASSGAHIFLGADKENRLCLPNTRFLLHQPTGGVRGQASDIQIEAEQIIKMRDRVNRMIARETGQTYERIAKDTQRNYWMSAEAAVEYGIVGKIIHRIDEA